MAKKKGGRKNNRLQIETKIVEIPPGVSTEVYAATLARAVKTGELPEGWKINLRWRNPDTKKGRSRNWQEGEFNRVIRESRSGFATVVRRGLKAAAGDVTPEPKRKPTKKTKKPKLPAAELRARRSAASKKGWETRRRNKAK